MDERFLKDEGREIFTGNELILKGALEAEAALITGYPGSPVSEIFDVAYANRELLKKHGVLAELANNEALSVARLNGSRMAGVRALAVMKSVGFHVASDGLALGNLSEPNNAGGSVVVVGDDPWIESTQVNNDSRFLSQHLHMPVLEPSTFQEIKDWIGLAFELSSASNLYMTYVITTPQADGGGTVWVRPNRYPKIHTEEPTTLDSSTFNLDNTVLLPPKTWAREATLEGRFQTLFQEVRRRKLNTLSKATREKEGSSSDQKRKPIGFVSSGLSYCYLEHALAELGLAGRFPILKLGMTYPLDPAAALELARQVETIIVVEEKRSFVETQIVQILHDARQAGTWTEPTEVWGKNFPDGQVGIPVQRGINASILSEKLIALLLNRSEALSDNERARLRAEKILLEATAVASSKLPARTPTFCPGCPHRDSSSIMLEIQKDFKNPSYMKSTHGKKPVDLVFHGETGCFTMLMFEPNKPLMHNYSGMGLGGGTGAGLDPFVTNKQVVFLGDSTFFHSGMVAISDSIKSGQDITYIILDNKTTAMTGHQPTPGTDLNLMGDRTAAQDIERIVQGMSSQTKIPVTRVNPAYRDSYRELLEDTILQDGVKVIIADKECGLTYHRQQRRDRQRTQRRLGYVPTEKHINITPDVCEFCLECTNTTGCPGLTIEATAYGPKIVTDRSSCVSDGACAKVKVCPSFEEVLVTRTTPTPDRRWTPPGVIPEPTLHELKDPWYCFTAGVGGMGAGLVSSILVQAAHRDGLRVLFSDKKGLAIRNGGVYGHLLITRSGGVWAPLVPYGKTDLILGIDLLETARSLDGSQALRVAGAERTSAVVNTALNLTVRMLMGEDVPSAATWETIVRERVRPDGYWGRDVSEISNHFFGSTLYVNMILLGVAYQRGDLPLSGESLEWAITQSVSAHDKEPNLHAFRAGRCLVVNPESLRVPQTTYSTETLITEKANYLSARYGASVAQKYRWMIDEALQEVRFEERLERDLARRVYDLIHYEDLALARRYLDLVLATARRDRAQWQFRATEAVIHNAFKVIAIKDEVYVAHLLTSAEKHERDRARFDIDQSRGDRLTYRHLTRPEFTVFGRTIRWNMVTHDWQLRIVRHLKFLRRLLPGWHQAEKSFRDWYLSWVERFDAETETDYEVWLNILRVPEAVRGYREIRYPLMEKARRQVDRFRAGLRGPSRPVTAPPSR